MINIGGYDIEIDYSGETIIYVSYNEARQKYDSEIYLSIYELRELLHQIEMKMILYKINELLNND